MGKRRAMREALGTDAKAAEAFVKAGTPSPPKPKPEPVLAGLVSLTVRIPHDLARALRRVAADRSVDRVEPYTQQAIVTEALERWLEE